MKSLRPPSFQSFDENWSQPPGMTLDSSVEQQETAEGKGPQHPASPPQPQVSWVAACPVPSSPLGAPQTLRSALCHDTSLQWIFQGTEGQQNKGADSGDMSAAIPGAGARRYHLRTKSVPWGRISGVSGLPGSASPCSSQSRSSHSSDFKT